MISQALAHILKAMTSGIGFSDKTSKDNPVAIAVFVNAQTLELLVGIRDVPQQF